MSILHLYTDNAGAITFLGLALCLCALMIGHTITSNRETLDNLDIYARILGERTFEDERVEKQALKDPYKVGFVQGEMTGLPAPDELVRKHYPKLTDEQLARYQEGRAAGVAAKQ